jgi:hypothetical protein
VVKSYDGRLIVVKSIIFAIPNYDMCIMKWPLGFPDHVQGSPRNFSGRQGYWTKRKNVLLNGKMSARQKKGRKTWCSQSEDPKCCTSKEKSLWVHEQARYRLGPFDLASTIWEW